MFDKTNLIILFFFLALWWFYKNRAEMFATSPGTMVQLATSSTDPSWYYGYVPTYPAMYVPPVPGYAQYVDCCGYPEPWSGW